MATLVLTTEINAPIETCFDLARDVEFHVRSMEHSREELVERSEDRLLELGQVVTFRGRHFWIVHRHSARITEFDRPHYFRDSMSSGRFTRFDHSHHFCRQGDGTLMRDTIDFALPFGWLGSAVSYLIVRPYLRRLLDRRNAALKRAAESST